MNSCGDSSHVIQDGEFVLLPKSQHNDAGVCVGRIRLNVGEIQIQGQENAPLLANLGSDRMVVSTREILIPYGVSIESKFPEIEGCLNRKVLVDLKSHAL